MDSWLCTRNIDVLRACGGESRGKPWTQGEIQESQEPLWTECVIYVTIIYNYYNYYISIFILYLYLLSVPWEQGEIQVGR